MDRGTARIFSLQPIRGQKERCELATVFLLHICALLINVFTTK